MTDNANAQDMEGALQGALLVSIPRAVEITGLGRTSIYRLIADGTLATRKFGQRVLVETASIRTFVAALPAASIRQQPGAKRRQAGA